MTFFRVSRAHRACSRIFNNSNYSRFMLLSSVFACVFAVISAQSAPVTDTNLNMFGFTGPEIFPIDPQISQLRVADLDGDGLNDLVLVNNARSKINILWNQTGKTNGI